MSDASDGRNPEWPVDGVVVGMWEAVFAEHDLAATDVGRLRLALDDLHDALVLLEESREFADRERIAAVNAARSARKAARDLVAELTGAKRPGPGRPPKDGPIHGHRTQREKKVRNEAVPDDE